MNVYMHINLYFFYKAVQTKPLCFAADLCVQRVTDLPQRISLCLTTGSNMRQNSGKLVDTVLCSTLKKITL